MGREDLLEKEMATHTSILAWKIPWTEDPGRLQSKGLQRVGHTWVTEQQQQQQPELSISLMNWKDHCEFKLLEQILEDLGNVRQRMILRAQGQQNWSGERR